MKRPYRKYVLDTHLFIDGFRDPAAKEAWQQLGDVLAEMAREDGLKIARVSKSFANDILLAISCRDAGCVLVTGNTRDFRRIRRFVSFEFAAPWPWTTG